MLYLDRETEMSIEIIQSGRSTSNRMREHQEDTEAIICKEKSGDELLHGKTREPRKTSPSDARQNEGGFLVKDKTYGPKKHRTIRLRK